MVQAVALHHSNSPMVLIHARHCIARGLRSCRMVLIHPRHRIAGTAVLLQEVVSLDSLIAIYIAWIVARTGLSAPDHPPIHFVTPAEMAMRHGSPENSGLDLQALYNRNKGSIYLPQEWRPNDLRQKSALLHELVHHVQRFNKIELPCLAALERQAYDLQIKWLREQGVDDPYDLIKTNELTVYLVSTCRDGS
jgi:hypothetical protein